MTTAFSKYTALAGAVGLLSGALCTSPMQAQIAGGGGGRSAAEQQAQLDALAKAVGLTLCLAKMPSRGQDPADLWLRNSIWQLVFEGKGTDRWRWTIPGWCWSLRDGLAGTLRPSRI